MFDYKHMYNHISSTKANNAKSFTPPKTFSIDHTLPILAAIPLINTLGESYTKGDIISPHKTLANLAHVEYLNTPNGRVSVDIVTTLLKIYKETSRSWLVKQMTKNPRFGSLTPIPMYAFKLYHDIPYEAWDKTEETIKWMLGGSLECLYNFNNDKHGFTKEYYESILGTDIFTSNRTYALTYGGGKKAGMTDKLTSHKMNKVSWPVESNPSFLNSINYMIFQTWLANAEIRDYSCMILNPWNWDNVPETIDWDNRTMDIDGHIQEEEVVKKDPWDIVV